MSTRLEIARAQADTYRQALERIAEILSEDGRAMVMLDMMAKGDTEEEARRWLYPELTGRTSAIAEMALEAVFE